MLNWIIRIINKRQKELFTENKRLEEELEFALNSIRLIGGEENETYRRLSAHADVIRKSVDRGDGPAIKVSCDSMEKILKDTHAEIAHIKDSAIRRGERRRAR